MIKWLRDLFCFNKYSVRTTFLNGRHSYSGAMSLRAALSIAKGEQPAASITVNGHKYVPASRISQQDAELERLRRHVELLQEKDASQCGCSIDRPDDVCLFHARMKAEARRAAFTEAAAWHDSEAARYMRKSEQRKRATHEISAAVIRAKAEETGRG